MTARHAATVRPCAHMEPLDGDPTIADALDDAAANLPVTDPRGALQELARRYRARQEEQP